MKYICSICGYVYDEVDTAFGDLPESWVCPLCGAEKDAFKSEEAKVSDIPSAEINIETNLSDLSAGALSAVFSNLARGCEKQYKPEESALFTELANYFKAVTPEIESADKAFIKDKLSSDLNQAYPSVRSAASNEKDRGTLRVTVWGEKVTGILSYLLSRYEKLGESLVKDKQIWVCSICGFVYVGDKAPDLCPVCKVPDWKFEKIEGRRAV